MLAMNQEFKHFLAAPAAPQHAKRRYFMFVVGYLNSELRKNH
jgi:hypothetical protein